MNKVLRILIVLLLSTNLVAAQTAQPTSSDIISPGDNLVAQGIPPVPRTLAEDASRYANSRSASLTSWHPIRREMLISTRFGETHQVHEVQMPRGARRQLTFFPDEVAEASYNPRTGDYFIFSKDTSGNELAQLYRYDLATGKTTLLTDGRARNIQPVWSRSGDRIAYTSMRRDGQNTDLYVMNPLEPQTDRLLAQSDGGYWWPLDWSPDDRQILFFQYVSADEVNLWIVDATTGMKTRFMPQENVARAEYRRAQFSHDGRGVYLATNRDSEFLRLAYVDLATKEHRFLSDHIRGDIISHRLSPDGATLAFVANEDGVSRLHLLDTRTNREKPQPQLPVGVISDLNWHKNNRDLGFTLQTARYPNDVYSYNNETGRIERWTHSETGGLNTDSFPEASLIRWPSFDGKQISGFLYRPPANHPRFTGRRPVIIDIHGGPEEQALPDYNGRYNYFLNEMGAVIIFPNVRGSSGYGKTFAALDNGARREDSVRDIGALLDWIRTQPDLDADRVMVQGASYGGFMTLATAIRYGDRIRAAVSYAGVSSLATTFRSAPEWLRALLRAEYGDERDPRIREFWTRISPLDNAQRIRCPLLIIHGARDPRVPATEAEQIVTAVRRNETPVWYLLANNEGHGFANRSNQDYQFFARVLFIRQFLLN